MRSLPFLNVQRGSKAEHLFESQALTNHAHWILSRSVDGVTRATVYSDCITLKHKGFTKPVTRDATP